MLKFRTLLTVLLSIIILSLTSCIKDREESFYGGISIKSYREIPGITAEEIAAIDKIKTQRQSFSYGLLLSQEASELSGGSLRGFSRLLCDLLSELFEIPFVLETLDWQDLKNRFDSYDIDFTSTFNSTNDIPNNYFKTSPITGNRLVVFAKEGEADIVSEYDLRGLKAGFFAGSSTERITRNAFPRVDFFSVNISSIEEMAEMLMSGAIDVFIMDRPDIFTFFEYSHVVKAAEFPYIYVPVAISTANPDLEPVISAVTKYLMAGGINDIVRLISIGENEYAEDIFNYSLTDEELSYIARLKASGEKVPIGVSNGRYPVAYFDEEENRFQGIAVDVLAEISKLTGIEFEVKNDQFTAWSELENMLKEGKIALISQLIQNNPRREYAIWPDSHYYSARYAFLSNLNFPFLNINQVPYTRVGVGAGTVSETIYKTWFPEDTAYKAYNGSDEGLDALEKGEIDLYLTLDYTLLYESNYRENIGQKINILLDSPVEKVSFGLNINEEILCSIISKAQSIINTERIVRSWTSRIFDPTVQIAKERIRYLTITVICLLSLLIIMLVSIFIYFRLKKANAESSSNLQVLLDMLPVGVRILSLEDFSLLYSNKACLDLFGCTSFEEQVQGQNGFNFMPEIQPDGRSTSEHMVEIFKNDSVIAEIQCLKLSGEPFICRMTSRTVNYSDKKGRVHRVSLAAMEDVTAERKHQETLQNAVLREHEANQLKTRFLAMMSHEIRTPMNAILGITEIQLQNDILPQDTEEALARINDSGNLLLNIINDILDLSKIEAGKLEIIPVKYNIPSLINDVVQLNRLRYDDKPIEMILDVDENTPHNLYGDELRLRQVLNNIISNAYKYTEKGTIVFSIYSEAMQNKGKENNIMMIFKVSDTGQGMTKEHLVKLFEEYTRFNMDTNRTTIGTGLGMSITKRILDLMSGEIIVESEPGKGSVFTVRLPQKRLDSVVCGKDTVEKLQNFRFNSTLMSRKSRILREYMPYGSVLIVDDVETNIYVTKGMLLPYGLKVDTASSGFEAIDKIKEGNVYDIIFMDHMMPKMDGIKAVSIIRELGYKNDIIALTANALVGQSDIFLENGFNGYITKPIDSREMNHILNEFIRNKKPPEIVKAARREQRDRNTEQIKKVPVMDLKSNEVKQFFLMDAESAISVLENGKWNGENPDIDSYEITVHGMKSALANIGEQELSDYAKELEIAAKNRDFSVMENKTSAFVGKLKELKKKFTPNTEGISRRNTEKPKPEDADYLKEKLLKIKEACAELEPNLIKDILDEIKQKTWSRDIYDFLDEINVHLLHNAFKKAEAAAQSAMEYLE